jgi:tripartite-type tricarboxylate transporter receptor subunit TctC
MSLGRMVKFTATALAVLTVFVSAKPASAQGYPARKITIVVAFAAGGFADTMARLVARGLSDRLQQSVVVENRPGAGGNIAAELVAHAPTDGYTLLATTTALAINDTLFQNKPFAASDLKTVAMVASSPEALATSAHNPASTLPEFIKAMHGKVINFGSAGVGTGSHIEAEYFFKLLAKVPAQHIPFQGGAPAVNAAIAGQIDLLAATLGGGVAAQMNAGTIKGLGIAADKRAPVVPNVPTYAEQGFPNFTAASWVGIFAPAKTAPQILAALNGTIGDTVQSQAVATKLVALGFDPIVSPQTAADAMFDAEVKKWGGMVKALNLSIK